MSRRNPVAFVISRVFRIWPAFILVILVSALVLGPIYTRLSIADYFNSQQFSVSDYLISNIYLDIRYYLPGVFFELPYEAAVNGSLWTLYYEVGAYIGLLLMYLLGLFRGKWLATLALVSLLISQHYLRSDALHPILHQPILIQCFAFGALLALHKEFVIIHSGVIVFSWAMFYFLFDSVYSKYFLYISVFLTVLYLSGNKFLLKIRPKVDVSYGVYLWGFPVQQILAYHFLDFGVRFNQVASIVACIALGCLSWFLVEERFILYGSRVSKMIGASMEQAFSSVALKCKSIFNR